MRTPQRAPNSSSRPSAMGFGGERGRLHEKVRKACVIGVQMRELGIRPNGGIRIDSSTSVAEWDAHPAEGTQLIIQTFRDGIRRGARTFTREGAQGVRDRRADA